MYILFNIRNRDSNSNDYKVFKNYDLEETTFWTDDFIIWSLSTFKDHIHNII